MIYDARSLRQRLSHATLADRQGDRFFALQRSNTFTTAQFGN